jgi:uncharacterized membrane protein
METNANRRYDLLDTLRGLTLCSMFAYHAAWDLVHLFGMRWAWFDGPWAMVWQQSICWSFLLLAGFCWPLGKRPFRRGMMISAAGILVTAATVWFNYEERIIFGVLTLFGFLTLIMICLAPLLEKVPPLWGMAGSAAAFILLRDINNGYLGWGNWHVLAFPPMLYQGSAATFLGFLDPGFYSSDYFSLLPWGFLYLLGYFAAQYFLQNGRGLPGWFRYGWRPLSFLGRHSLLLYLAHQPAIYLVLYAVFRLI